MVRDIFFFSLFAGLGFPPHFDVRIVSKIIPSRLIILKSPALAARVLSCLAATRTRVYVVLEGVRLLVNVLLDDSAGSH
jgi:hypothetical protein